MASKAVTTPKVDKRWTLEEWLKLPEGLPFYELEDGKLVEMPSPRMEHQRLVGRLYNILDRWAEEHDLGVVIMAVDVALPTGKGYIPDLNSYAATRKGNLSARTVKSTGHPIWLLRLSHPAQKSETDTRRCKVILRQGLSGFG